MHLLSSLTSSFSGSWRSEDRFPIVVVIIDIDIDIVIEAGTDLGIAKMEGNRSSEKPIEIKTYFGFEFPSLNFCLDRIHQPPRSRCIDTIPDCLCG